VETWFTQLEHHVNLAATLAILTWIFRNHKVIVRGKDRLNTLWYRYCAQTKQPHTPIENGTRAFVPGHHEGD
jgi:hypothetical protein